MRGTRFWLVWGNRVSVFSLSKGRSIMRKLALLTVLMALLASGVVSQAQEETSEVEPWVCPEGFEGQTLKLFSWSTYTAETTIPDFEEACGVTVEYSIM